MKQTITVLGIAAVLLATGNITNAQTKPTVTVTPKVTKTASPSAAVVEKEVQQLKEKVAAITERKKNQKAVAGTITAVNDKSIAISTEDNGNLEVKIDETITQFYQIAGATKKEIKKDAFKKDNYVIVTGPLQDRTITANAIYIDEKYVAMSGKITEVNKGDFSIKVATQDKETYTLDIQSKTTQQIINIKTLALEKTGFTKLKEGDTIHFVIKKSSEDAKKTRFDAHKIVVIPQEYFQK